MAPPTPTDELASTLIKVRCGTQSYSLLPPRSLPDSESHSPRRPIAPSRECAGTISWSGSGVLNSVQMMHRVPGRKLTPTRRKVMDATSASRYPPGTPPQLSVQPSLQPRAKWPVTSGTRRALKTSEARRPSRTQFAAAPTEFTEYRCVVQPGAVCGHRIQSLMQLGSPTTTFVLNSVSRNQANVPGETR